MAISDMKPEDMVFFVAFVVYRYRNNMFHGNKGIHSWLQYGEQIRLCTEAMQAFVSHAESMSPTISTLAAA